MSKRAHKTSHRHFKIRPRNVTKKVRLMEKDVWLHVKTASKDTG